MIRYLETILREIRNLMTPWWSHYLVMSHNIHARAQYPIIWKFDTLKAIYLGNNVSIGAFSEIVAVNNSEFSNVKGHLIIEDSVGIGTGCNIRAAGGEIFIGKHTLIAQNVSIIAGNHSIVHEQLYRNAPWDEKRVGVYIGSNVWIGAGAILLPGIKIGDNSIIAAGSIVTKDVGENEIWTGTAAKLYKKLERSSVV